MTGLTHMQARLLRVLEREIPSRNGVAPSYDEMRQALGLRSKAGIVRLVDALSERGYVQRVPGKVRSISLVPSAGGRRTVEIPDDLTAPLARAALARGMTRDELVADLLRHALEVPQ